MAEISQSIRILYLEDNPADADLVRRSLARSAPEHRLTVVNRVAAALECLRPEEPSYDLLLVDLRLPDGSGLEVLAEVKARNLPVAVVLLTGSGTQQAAIAALKAGADDYLVKEGDYLENLPAILANALGHFRQRGQGAPLRVLYGANSLADLEGAPGSTCWSMPLTLRSRAWWAARG
ncbi:response regulator [Desulfurivibrio dismutans]|uniref:response regulator n=1 Tax=Desulfurivibrio dismutans TaxID=1398908 RepID=UPI0023DA395D|nr:response regulator [Desulfurivibrio alkaliphilus]MDF1614522.1 response regulator [Desulfurivibrio alkaliphilus]